jgi:hypothetical protein
MRFGTCNVRSLYRLGSLTTVSRILARCKLDLLGVWGKEGTVRPGDYIFSMENETKIIYFEQDFFTPQNGVNR